MTDSTDLLAGIELIVFDKDGTLIDFHAMWETWARRLAVRVRLASGRSIEADLERALGIAPDTGRATPGSPLAVSTMERLRQIAVEIAVGVGSTLDEAEASVAAAWKPPDPVRDAVPLADLPRLFRALRAGGMRIAVVTADDRAPTLMTLAALAIADLVDATRCADDGLPPKPSPDALLAVCSELGIRPAATAMVGDTPADLEMAVAAGAGLAIGVLSGAGTRESLEPSADVLVKSVSQLMPAARSALPSAG